MTNDDLTYDLGERTARYGEDAIEFCLSAPNKPVTAPLITQYVKAATSVGANYGEADDAESKPDFRHKIALCRKEARESKHWCRMLAKALPAKKTSIRPLWREARELHLIFCRIIRTTDANLRAANPPRRRTSP
jgi:four helix bundle protein